MQIDLSGKIAVITGATGDLGRVMARTVASCGADVVVHYHRQKAMADRLCKEITAMGRRVLAVAADVTDLKAVKAMQRRIKKELGDPDIIVNNAVIQYKWVHVLDQPAEDYESQFRSCVLHNLYMVKAFVPAMVERKWGRVIGINTECYMQCWPTQSAYVSGKHGMHGLLQSLAKEIGRHGITVNQIAPGWMYSDRDREQEKVIGESSQASTPYANMLPLKHRGDDQDIANVVAFLASDLAKFITGGFIPVHGGGTTIPAWL